MNASQVLGFAGSELGTRSGDSDNGIGDTTYLVDLKILLLSSLVTAYGGSGLWQEAADESRGESGLTDKMSTIDRSNQCRYNRTKKGCMEESGKIGFSSG